MKDDHVHSQRDKIKTGITLFDKDIAIKPDNSHAQILKEIDVLVDKVYDYLCGSDYCNLTKEEFVDEYLRTKLYKIKKDTEAATLKKVEETINYLKGEEVTEDEVPEHYKVWSEGWVAALETLEKEISAVKEK